MKIKSIGIVLIVVAVALVGIVVLKHSPLAAMFIWNASHQGAWILPLVLVSAILDSVHPCSFSILLVTITFLFGLQLTRKRILQIGGLYIFGIFLAYLLIGLGVLKVLHLFSVPHFMGKLGASLLILFGIINIVNEFFPKFPLKLKIPSGAHSAIGRLMEKASFPAALGLGLLVGICQFPCMGGPYLMVIGLLHDQMTYGKGFAYLVLYNLILILPLATVLVIAADKTIVDKAQEWKKQNLKGARFWAGLAMVILGILILFI
jgi:cytochrome c biogenesis protein CcdA